MLKLLGFSDTSLVVVKHVYEEFNDALRSTFFAKLFERAMLDLCLRHRLLGESVLHLLEPVLLLAKVNINFLNQIFFCLVLLTQLRGSLFMILNLLFSPALFLLKDELGQGVLV